jgi:hypothetical protein
MAEFTPEILSRYVKFISSSKLMLFGMGENNQIFARRSFRLILSAGLSRQFNFRS